MSFLHLFLLEKILKVNEFNCRIDTVKFKWKIDNTHLDYTLAKKLYFGEYKNS